MRPSSFCLIHFYKRFKFGFYRTPPISRVVIFSFLTFSSANFWPILSHLSFSVSLWPTMTTNKETHQIWGHHTTTNNVLQRFQSYLPVSNIWNWIKCSWGNFLNVHNAQYSSILNNSWYITASSSWKNQMMEDVERICIGQKFEQNKDDNKLDQWSDHKLWLSAEDSYVMYNMVAISPRSLSASKKS